MPFAAHHQTFVNVALVCPEADHSNDKEKAGERKEEEVVDKVSVIIETDAIAHPGAVMIEACYASITVGAVFRPDRSSKQARAAKMLRFESRSKLCQLLYCLHKIVIFKNMFWSFGNLENKNLPGTFHPMIV